MHSQAQIDEYYAPAIGTPLHLWQRVCSLEGPGHDILAINPTSCDGAFPIIEYLRNEAGAEIANLNGTYAGVRQHSHIRLESTTNTLPVDLQNDAWKSDAQDIQASDVNQEVQNGVLSCTFKGKQLRLHIFTYHFHSGQSQRLFMLAWNRADHALGHDLVASVYRWARQLHEQIWVYHGTKGGWRKDARFFQAIHASRAEELVLSDGILQNLLRDTLTFFENRALYEELGVTWKRGILLLGPPGNGKTGMMKYLSKICTGRGISVLYVQTAASYRGPEWGMDAIFSKARRESPCVLLIEDIESLVTGATRTFMLNQLDGIESNEGVLVIATANDASKLDAAILNRPSRFDAKYLFDLPDATLRKRFIEWWLKEKIKIELIDFGVGGDDESSERLQAALVAGTEGWSFAFLKELFMSLLLSHAKRHDANATRIRADEIYEHLTILQVQVSMAKNAEGMAPRRATSGQTPSPVHTEVIFASC